MPEHRFPPPRSVEDLAAAFVAKESSAASHTADCVAVDVAKGQRVWPRGNAHRRLALRLAELLDASPSCGNVRRRVMCDFDHTCGDDSTGKRDDLFIACRDPAPDASGVRPDLARILLCDAISVVVMFSSLTARVVRSFRSGSARHTVRAAHRIG
jgi:hypothetical protein